MENHRLCLKRFNVFFSNTIPPIFEYFEGSKITIFSRFIKKVEKSSIFPLKQIPKMQEYVRFTWPYGKIFLLKMIF